MKNFYFILVLVLINILPTYAKHLHLEKEYQQFWCSANNGVMEYKLNDGARIDCLTSEYAVEFDFATKWAESIGQSLYYGLKTNRKPAVVLIMESPSKEQCYLNRLQTVANKIGIKVFTMTKLNQK